MMAKLIVLLAALACGASAKIFVFKADQCNTNFNTDANFLDAAGASTTAPVSFFLLQDLPQRRGALRVLVTRHVRAPFHKRGAREDSGKPPARLTVSLSPAVHTLRLHSLQPLFYKSGLMREKFALTPAHAPRLLAPRITARPSRKPSSLAPSAGALIRSTCTCRRASTTSASWSWRKTWR